MKWMIYAWSSQEQVSDIIFDTSIKELFIRVDASFANVKF